MKFWRISSPPSKSDYAFTFLNGSLSHPKSMPGVTCNVCEETWAGSRILPFEAPKVVRLRKPKDVWPLPLEQFDALRTEAERQIGAGSPRIMPGDSFQPAVLDVPSKPRADFLWGSLGSLVVSARINELLVRTCADSIWSAEVQLGKIGKKEAHRALEIPSTGEPEDLIAEAIPILRKSKVGPYFEVVPTTESKISRSIHAAPNCPGCLRPNIKNSKHRLVMADQLWHGRPIFFLATTRFVVVTEELKREIEHINPTNVAFEET